MSEAKLDPLTVAELDELERLEREASPGEWFNSYSAIVSLPLSREYDRLEALIPDGAEDNDPRWDALPETCVATVPRVAGDTPTRRGVADARLIAAARNALPRLIAMARQVAKDTDVEQAEAVAEECCCGSCGWWKFEDDGKGKRHHARYGECVWVPEPPPASFDGFVCGARSWRPVDENDGMNCEHWKQAEARVEE